MTLKEVTRRRFGTSLAFAAAAMLQPRVANAQAGRPITIMVPYTPGTGIEPTTGEVHLRHHISPTGFYRGRKVLKSKSDA